MSHAALTVDHPVMLGAPPFTPPLSLFLLLCRYNSYFCAYMCTCYTIMTKVCAHIDLYIMQFYLLACLLTTFQQRFTLVQNKSYEDMVFRSWVWENLTGLPRALASTPSISFEKNWNTNCDLGPNAQQQTSKLLVCPWF